MKNSKITKLYCFTPMVSLATFFIEFGLAFYIIYNYKQTVFSRLVVILLLMFGLFQLAEFALCILPNTLPWAKIGAASITLIPIIALHIVTLITRKSILLWLGYILGSFFIFFILSSPYLVLETLCTGNFVIFDPTNSMYRFIYFSYYMVFVLMGVWLLIKAILNRKSDYQLLIWSLISYLCILVPTLIANILVPYTRDGIPSIMCGFAVLTAIIVVVKVLPRYYKVSKLKH